MKQGFLAGVGLSLFVLFSALPSQADIVDEIVATVGSEVILHSELVAEVRSELDTMRRNAGSQAELDRLVDDMLRAALDQAVETKLLYREAQFLGVKISEDRVEASIDNFRKLYPTNEAFLAELEAFGESLSEFRERQHMRLMARSVYSSKVRVLEEEVVVDEADVVQYYEGHKDDFTRTERVLVRQIFLPVGTTPEQRAKARARLAWVREELDAGAAFDELAKRYSQGPSASQGGLIGWQQHGDFIEVLDAAVFDLPAGEVTPVLETQGGLHLMKVDERQEEGLAALDEVRIEIEPLLRARTAEERYRKWIDDLRKRSRVRIFL